MQSKMRLIAPQMMHCNNILIVKRLKNASKSSSPSFISESDFLCQDILAPAEIELSFVIAIPFQDAFSAFETYTYIETPFEIDIEKKKIKAKTFSIVKWTF